MKLYTYLIIPLFFLLSAFVPCDKSNIYSGIEQYIQTSVKDFDNIPEDRKVQLKKISLFVKTKLSSEKKADLVFICTHNSRRSHMAQIWAKTAADFYGITGINTFSGGTEASAFNANAIKALTKIGFKINPTTEGKNPVYEVKYSNEVPSIKAFSKKYNESPNPTSNFVAVMTCSQADKTCPTIEGSAMRVAIPYEDPKAFDGKPEQDQKYDGRCQQIATEMLYLFSLLKKK